MRPLIAPVPDAGIRPIVVDSTVGSMYGDDLHHAGIRPIVVDSTVGSMYGDDLHQFGLQNIARCIGWVLTEDEFYAKLGLPESQASAAG